MSRRNKNRPAGGTQPNTLTLDAFSNPLFRLGYGSQSPLEATSYPLTRMTGNYALLNSLYRENWVVQNVVGLMVDDMLREWYELKDAAPDQLKALHRAEQRAGLRRCMPHIHAGVHGSTGSPSEPYTGYSLLSGGADSSVQSEDIKGWENGKVLSLSKDKKYIILNPALKAGDKVLLLRVQRGQKFVVLSRVYEGGD